MIFTPISSHYKSKSFVCSSRLQECAWKEKVVELDFSTNPLLKKKQALASHAIKYARYRRHSSSPTTGHWLAFTIL